jgi:hypothetical protein
MERVGRRVGPLGDDGPAIWLPAAAVDVLDVDVLDVPAALGPEHSDPGPGRVRLGCRHSTVPRDGPHWRPLRGPD